mgnify:CR=1 FL=1
MLVLSRKLKQSLVIGDNVEITIVEIRGDQVRLAISAPKTITIYRKEIYDEIQLANVAATAFTKEDVDRLMPDLSQTLPASAKSPRKAKK